MSAPRHGASPRYTLTVAHRGHTRLVLGSAADVCELTRLLRGAFASLRLNGAVLRLTSTALSGACRWRFDGIAWRRQGAETTVAGGRAGA